MSPAPGEKEKGNNPSFTETPTGKAPIRPSSFLEIANDPAATNNTEAISPLLLNSQTVQENNPSITESSSRPKPSGFLESPGRPLEEGQEHSLSDGLSRLKQAVTQQLGTKEQLADEDCENKSKASKKRPNFLHSTPESNRPSSMHQGESIATHFDIALAAVIVGILSALVLACFCVKSHLDVRSISASISGSSAHNTPDIVSLSSGCVGRIKHVACFSEGDVTDAAEGTQAATLP